MVTVGIGSALDVVNKIPWHQTVQASVNFCIGSPFLFGCGDIGGSGSARATVILMYSLQDWIGFCHTGPISLWIDLFVFISVYFMCFCFILHSCRIIVSTVGWTWWDWSLILRTYLSSVLWHCRLGHLTRKSRLQYDLWCVWWDFKPCSVYLFARLHCIICCMCLCVTCSWMSAAFMIHWSTYLLT